MGGEGKEKAKWRKIENPSPSFLRWGLSCRRFFLCLLSTPRRAGALGPPARRRRALAVNAFLSWTLTDSRTRWLPKMALGGRGAQKGSGAGPHPSCTAGWGTTCRHCPFFPRTRSVELVRLEINQSSSAANQRAFGP